MASTSFIISLASFLSFLSILDQTRSQQFTFNGFLNGEQELALDRASIFKHGEIGLTNTSQNSVGHAFYRDPIQIFNKTKSPHPISFNTTFVFLIAPPKSGRGGYGLAFVLAPSPNITGGAAGHFLGLFNETNNGNSSNHLFAVEFDTVNGFNEAENGNGNHVGININSVKSEVQRAATYDSGTDTEQEDGIYLHSGDPIQAWVEYDGVTKVVNVTICPMGKTKPIRPLITHNLSLSDILLERTYVGFSASTGRGTNASNHYILGWSFSTTGPAPPLNLEALPIPTEETDSSSYPRIVMSLIISLCVVAGLLIGVLLCLTVYRRISRFERLEDWELECPHRFRYGDLYTATEGFKDNKIIGVGGFGTVYKAVMRNNGNEVAVKRITRNPVDGIREFVAEIESLGRLRHKNLVNLQGWCKIKNNLLLVYDYIPNGSLDSLLFHPRDNFILTWKQRFNIVKGIASGLLYLHEEWEQVVIHRDIKSSNVLIDAEMNGRLGDFGLARLYDHGTNSHTTNVVGTIGYIAPELARTGKASASSDVFAFGVLLLEVATGRRPLEAPNFILVDWVVECHQLGKILDAVDPKLGTNYDIQEVELVLQLGLLCSHQKPENRPTMRRVTRYFNGDENPPDLQDWGSYDSHRFSQISSRLLQLSSCELTSTSYHSSSVKYTSSSSLDAGR